MRGTLLVAATLLGVQVARCPWTPSRVPVRVATFNVENFPRDAEQVRGAFAEIRATGASLVAVQEITDPRALADGARTELGPSWRTWTTQGDLHRIGLVYDSDRVELESARTRDETRVVPGTRPTLEARVRVGAREERLLAVHLKAGDAVGVRAEQMRALDALARETPGEDVVILGDFNTLTDADRAGLSGLAASAGLRWVSEDLPCTAQWDRDEECRTAALDQILATDPAHRSLAWASGPCADGCPARDRCPVWGVSDHCPVTADLR